MGIEKNPDMSGTPQVRKSYKQKRTYNKKRNRSNCYNRRRNNNNNRRNVNNNYKRKKYRNWKQLYNTAKRQFTKEEVVAFCKLNAFKYLWRSNHKGTHQQDIDKAEWYLNQISSTYVKGE